MDPAHTNSGQQSTLFEHVGSRLPLLSTSYLTVHDQQELLRVACAEEPVRAVGTVMANSYRINLRLVPLMVVYLALIFVIVGAGFAPVPIATALVIYLTSVIGMIVAGYFLVRTSRDMRAYPWLAATALMRSIRELEKPQPHFGESCSLIHAAAGAYYTTFKQGAPTIEPLLGRSAPRQYRRPRELEAAKGATAIASQAWHLHGEHPQPLYAADQLRRAVLRISTGYWYQVADLNDAAGRDSFWSPPGGFSRLAANFTHDSTGKLIGLVTAVVALAVALIGVFWPN